MAREAACVKCGIGYHIVGPTYTMLRGEEEKLSYACNKCGYCIFLPCADAIAPVVEAVAPSEPEHHEHKRKGRGKAE